MMPNELRQKIAYNIIDDGEQEASRRPQLEIAQPIRAEHAEADAVEIRRHVLQHNRARR